MLPPDAVVVDQRSEEWAMPKLNRLPKSIEKSIDTPFKMWQNAALPMNLVSKMRQHRSPSTCSTPYRSRYVWISVPVPWYKQGRAQTTNRCITNFPLGISRSEIIRRSRDHPPPSDSWLHNLVAADCQGEWRRTLRRPAWWLGGNVPVACLVFIRANLPR